MVDPMSEPRPQALSIISVVTTGNMSAQKFGAAYQSSPWLGDLAELLVYDRALAPGERQAVEDYLVRSYRPYVPSVGTPAITPAGGVFSGSTTVQIATSTPGAVIHYTLDGSEPTSLSEPYAGPFEITETTTVKARAFLEGYEDSAVATASFVRAEDSPVVAADGLALWLRADAGIATNAGDWVTQWADQSGRDNHGYQSDGTLAPLLVRDGANGLPVLRFDGGDTVRFTTRMSTIRTVFWVVSTAEVVGGASSRRSLLGDDSFSWAFAGGSGAPGAIWDGFALAAVKDGLTSVNGVAVAGTTTARPTSLSVVSLVTTGDAYAQKFGAAYQSLPWLGDLAELIVYDRALTSSERKGVEDYLLSKYGIGGQVATPSISPAGGVFAGTVEVTLATQTAGAEIRYTLDGTEPTLASAVYETPLVVTSTLTVKAKAWREGLAESATAVAGFTREAEATPKLVAGLRLWWRADAGVPGGEGDYWEDQSGLGNHGYQTNGAATPRLVPDVANGLPAMRFDGGDTVRFTTRMTTIRTVFWVVSTAEVVGGASSRRSLLGDDSFSWAFAGGSGAPGAIWDGFALAAVKDGLTSVNGVAVAGTTTARPTSLSVVSLVTTGDAYAQKFGAAYQSLPWLGDLAELIVYDRALTSSERKGVEDYLLSKYGIGGQVATPSISPAGGVFAGTVEVTLATQTAGAEIRYTLDGTEPTLASAVYETPLVVTSTLTVKAKAWREGLAESATAVAGFTREAEATPKLVAGLRLWWRADAGVPGGEGDYWEDQSGLGNHGYQTNGAATPRLVPDVANGLPAMRFDGGDTVRFTTRMTTIRTVFWVVSTAEVVGGASSRRSLLGDDSFSWAFAGGSGAPGAIWDGFALAAVKDGLTSVNGVAVAGTTTARPTSLSVVSLVTTGDAYAQKFGAAYQSSPWLGDLAELIVYDRALNEAERRQVEDYLNARYRLFVR
jgi:hypothetical protein